MHDMIIIYFCSIMSMYKSWTTHDDAIVGIWKIEEDELYFTTQLGIHFNHIHHPKRRLETLAGRFLLTQLQDNFPIHHIVYSISGKPVLETNNNLHFSISHSFPYVAAMIHPSRSVGIDIQSWKPSIMHIKSKFLSETELKFIDDNIYNIHKVWCVKEAVYKYQGLRGVDFKLHMPITKVIESTIDTVFYVDPILLGNVKELAVIASIDANFVLAYL
jgi:4'-phosphopantetheinyl transferase